MAVTDPSFFGTLVFRERATEDADSSGNFRTPISVIRKQGEWRPPERLAKFLPDGFSIPIECWTDPDGLRRVVPRCSFEELIVVGAVGGLAVIHGLRSYNRQVGQTYRAMLRIHLYVRGRAHHGTRGMQEHLTREFEYSRDLFIRLLGRFSDDERDVLPDDVGLNVDGEGHRFSVAQLTELGRRAAREAGHRNPTSKHAIAYGLYEAAKLNPLDVDREQVPVLVQMALFDIDNSENVPSEELIDIVTERLLEAIHRHLDDPKEKFDNWFTGPGSSLIKQIAKQRNKRGGELCQKDVRQALLQLGWRSYEYVGQCVHLLMSTIKNSMPDPLTDEERRLFERMYESQPFYGNLPLAILAERANAVRLAVQEIWAEPENCDHVRVLHRLLAYYADMARRRRQADRQSKQRCQAPATSPEEVRTEKATDAGTEAQSPDGNRRVSSGHHAGSVQFNENIHSSHRHEESQFAVVAEHIRESYGIECGAGCEYWEYGLAKESKQCITIEMRCTCGRVVQNIELSRDDFTAIAEQVLHRERTPSASPTLDVQIPGDEG